MSTKTFIWIGVLIGSTVGSLIPLAWGASLFSFSSIIWSGVGSLAGIWTGFKAGQYF